MTRTSTFALPGDGDGSAAVATHEGTYNHGLIATALQAADIGVSVQAYSANLASLAAVTPGAAGLAILADTTEADVRSYLSLVPGTDVQAYSANLTTLAGITPGTAGQAILADATVNDVQTYLSLVPGTDVQAYDADLAGIAGLTYSNGDIIYYNSGFQRLAKGSDGQVLTLASGVPSWAAAGGGGADPLLSLTSAMVGMAMIQGSSTSGMDAYGALNGVLCTDANSNTFWYSTTWRLFQQITSSTVDNAAYSRFGNTNAIGDFAKTTTKSMSVRFGLYELTDLDFIFCVGASIFFADHIDSPTTIRFAGIEFMPSKHSDTEFKFGYSDASTHTRVATGVTPSPLTLYEFKMTITTTQIDFELLDSAGSSLATHSATANLPSGAVPAYLWLGTITRTTATRAHGIHSMWLREEP